MKRFNIPALLVLVCSSATAQNVVHVPFTSDRWQFSGSESLVVLHKGEQALRMQGGQAWLEDVDFSSGTIEFDISFSEVRGFHGVRWNVQDRRNFEEFYFRSHLSGKPDANQYTPVVAAVSAWQLFHGPGYSAPTVYSDAWMHVRIVTGEDIGEVFIDADTSAFTFRLKGGWDGGGMGVYASNLNVAYFANFSYREGLGAVQGIPVEYQEVAPGTVQEWQVSDPFSEEASPPGRQLTGSNLEDREWQSLTTEEKGITNLARAAVGKDGRTMLARVTIYAARERVASVRFGFSDRVSVYLNGSLLYKGDNTYISRDYRYLGTIGYFDELPLSLHRGQNDLVFVVSEGFGGWGVAAIFPDVEGISFDDGVVKQE